MSKTIVLALAAVVASLVAFHSSAVVPARTGLAIEELRATAAQRPTDPAIHNDLANLLELAGRISEAEEAYRGALAIDPAFHTARVNLAMLLQETDRTREAKRELKKVIDAEPERAWAHYQLGVIAEWQGRRKRAIASYAKAFRLDPSLSFAKNNPQIVDNQLLVQSLLAAFGTTSPAVTAPRDYADPEGVGRAVAEAIRSGLEDQPKTPASAERPAAVAARRPVVGGGLEKSEVDTTVLDPSDLRPGSRTGQVEAADGTGGARSRRDRSAVGGAIYQGPTGRSGSELRTAPDRSGGSRGGSFRPGRLSTGRLETDLVRRPVLVDAPA